MKNFTVYRASAGSGKTFTLVREYLTLALCGGSDEAIKHDFRHILAITFTNQATNQMKEKILEYVGALQDPVKLRERERRVVICSRDILEDGIHRHDGLLGVIVRLGGLVQYVLSVEVFHLIASRKRLWRYFIPCTLPV